MGGFSAIATATALALAACTSSIAAYSGAPTSAPSSGPELLPREAVVSLNVVQRSFPKMTLVARSGDDDTAAGNPVATRSVSFTNAAGTQKVTISVDLYADSGDASSAFAEAVEKSEAVPGFKPLTVPNVAKKTFAGTVTQGTETHVGLGALTGKLTVGVTLAGLAASSANINNLVSLARRQVATAQRNASAGT
jgi:hypothetical protein